MLAISLTDVPGRFESLKRAHVCLSDGSDVEVEIEAAWQHKNHLVLKLAGVDSIDQADRFRNSDLWVSRGERGQLPPGEYFQSDLVGCSVVDEGRAKRLEQCRDGSNMAGLC